MGNFTKNAQKVTQVSTFITTENNTNNLNQQVPEGYKLVPIEIKNKRVQLVFTPSLLKKAKEKAKSQNLSFNAYVTKLIEKDMQ